MQFLSHLQLCQIVSDIEKDENEKVGLGCTGL